MESPFMTLAEVARYLRYEEPDGTLTPRQLANCREWLRRRGIVPSIHRGLFRRELVETAIARNETVRGRRGRRTGG